MKHARSLLATLLLAPALGHAQCNPYPLRPNLLPPCATLGDKLTEAHEAAKTFVGEVDALNRGIASARARFFSEFPNGPGYADTEAGLLAALEGKDLTYLLFALPTGINSDAPKLVNFADMMGGGNTLFGDWREFPSMIDGGIKPYAFPLFVMWVRALRAAEGRTTDGAFATPFIMGTAILDRSNERQAYERARNWAELVGGPVDISKYVTPKQYMLLQMEADVSYVALQAKPARNGRAATEELYAFFESTFGEQEVAAAAAATLRAPKNSVGGLATRAEIEIGGYVGFASPNPYMLFLTELTKGSPHAYAVALCIDPYALASPNYLDAFNTKDTWVKAVALYDQVVARYGEVTTLAAAARLSAVAKDDKGGPRGDPKNSGSRYWFQALLKDLQLPLPEIPQLRVGAYDGRWLGHIVQVRGTVTRVDYERGESPPYATIHFREGNLTVYTPNSDMWQASWGEDFGGLIGRVVEVWGEVNEWRDGGGVRVLDRHQVALLAPGASVQVAESHPDWLDAPLVAPTLVESPEYASWKRFPVGAAARYTTYLMTEYQPGTDTYTRTVLSRDEFRLARLDGEQAVVSYRSVSGLSGSASSAEATFKSTEPQKADSDPRKLTTGEETLVINGRSFATRWEKRENENDPFTFTKIWRSDQVPGGIVRRSEQRNSTYGGGKPNRSIQDMIFAPVDGADAELIANAVPAGAAATVAQPPVAPAAAAAAAATRVESQAEFSQRFNQVVQRAARATSGLEQYQRTGKLAPPEIRNAEQRLNSEMSTVSIAFAAQNLSFAQQSLRTFETSVAEIERFLAQ